MRVRQNAVTCLSAAAAAALLLLTGCTGASESPTKAVEAAIVPGADLLVRVDYQRYRTSPAAETIRNLRREQDPALMSAEEERARKLEEATGVSSDDLRAIFISGDLDGIDIESPDRDGEYLKLNAVLAVVFGRALTLEQFEAGLNVLALERPGARVEAALIGGRKTLTIVAAERAEPMLYGALSGDGRTIFLAPNSPSIEGVFLREGEKRAEVLSETLLAAEGELPKSSQLKTAFVVPEQLRRQIETRVSAVERQAMKNPGAGIIVAFLTPFRKLTSVSLGARFTEGVNLGVAADLAGESEALQAATLIQTFLVPLIKARLTQRNPGSLDDLDGKFSVASSGPKLRLEVNLKAEELKALRL
jgi:hypothetical protein